MSGYINLEVLQHIPTGALGRCFLWLGYSVLGSRRSAFFGFGYSVLGSRRGAFFGGGLKCAWLPTRCFLWLWFKNVFIHLEFIHRSHVQCKTRQRKHRVGSEAH